MSAEPATKNDVQVSESRLRDEIGESESRLRGELAETESRLMRRIAEATEHVAHVLIERMDGMADVIADKLNVSLAQHVRASEERNRELLRSLDDRYRGVPGELAVVRGDLDAHVDDDSRHVGTPEPKG
jgi:hypothetical protein